MSKPETTDATAATTTATDIDKNHVENVETTESIHKPSNAANGKGKDKAAGDFIRVYRNYFEPKFCLITLWMEVCLRFGWKNGFTCQGQSIRKNLQSDEWKYAFDKKEVVTSIIALLI